MDIYISVVILTSLIFYVPWSWFLFQLWYVPKYVSVMLLYILYNITRKKFVFKRFSLQTNRHGLICLEMVKKRNHIHGDGVISVLIAKRSFHSMLPISKNLRVPKIKHISLICFFCIFSLTWIYVCDFLWWWKFFIFSTLHLVQVWFSILMVISTWDLGIYLKAANTGAVVSRAKAPPPPCAKRISFSYLKNRSTPSM